MEYIGETMMGTLMLLLAACFHAIASAGGSAGALVAAIMFYTFALVLFLPVCVNIIRDMMENRR